MHSRSADVKIAHRREAYVAYFLSKNKYLSALKETAVVILLLVGKFRTYNCVCVLCSHPISLYLSTDNKGIHIHTGTNCVMIVGGAASVSNIQSPARIPISCCEPRWKGAFHVFALMCLPGGILGFDAAATLRFGHHSKLLPTELHMPSKKCKNWLWCEIKMGPPCSWVVVYFGSTARLKSACLCQLRLCTIIRPLHDLVKEINRNNCRKAVAARRAVFLSQFTWNRQTDQRVDWGSWSLAAGTL